MQRELLPRHLTRLISPSDLKAYVRTLDWKPVEGVNGKAAVFHRPDSRLHQVIVPIDSTLADYDDAVAEAVYRLADFEKRPALQVLEQLLFGSADLLAFREVSPDAESGSLALGHAARLIEGVRRLLLAAAHLVLSPQPVYVWHSSAEAIAFVERCRFAQTERGSFVVNVACPLDYSEEPFARQVTGLLFDTLCVLARADRSSLDELLGPARPRGISANLCEALLLLRPLGDRACCIVTATWARNGPPAPTDRCRSVELRQEAFATAEEAARRLRTGSPPAGSRFYGFVVGLERDRTSSSLSGGEAILRLFGFGEEFVAKAFVESADHEQAIRAYQSGELVSFRGVLHRRPGENRIDRVTHFQRVVLEDAGSPDPVSPIAEVVST